MEDKKNKLLRISQNLTEIIIKGDALLVNEFEDYFNLLECTLDTPSQVVSANRMLVRKAYLTTVYLFGKESSLDLLNMVINDVYTANEYIDKFLDEMDSVEESIEDKQITMEWMQNNYYDLSNENNLFKVYCTPTQYLIDKMCSVRNK